MVKVTFTLDDETVAALRQASQRLGKPQSMIVREAVREYGARAGRLSEDERGRMLRTIDAMLAQPPTRTAAAVDRELRALRDDRRRAGRQSA